MNGTKKDLLQWAGEIEAAANRVLKPKATDPKTVFADRGWTEIPQDQLDQHQREAHDAWQGSMQYAQELRRIAGSLGVGERAGAAVEDQVRMVRHAVEMEGWLSNNQTGAWNHAQSPLSQVWDNGAELRDLQNGEHHLQKDAAVAQSTGVMQHEGRVDGQTVERVRIVPNPDLPPVEDPDVPAPPPVAPAPTNQPTATSPDGTPATTEPTAAEKHWRTQADELRTQAEDLANEADDETDEARKAELYEEAADLETAAESCEEQANYERDHPLPRPLNDDGTTMTQEETDRLDQAAAEGRPGYWEAPVAQVEETQQEAQQEALPTLPDTKTVNWAQVEENAGRFLTQEDRDALEMAQLKADSDALVSKAEQVETAGRADTGIEINWDYAEKAAGRAISQEERNDLEVEQLLTESESLLRAAEQAEDTHSFNKDEIVAAAADGETITQRHDRQQAEMDTWEGDTTTYHQAGEPWAAEASADDVPADDATTSYDDEPWTVRADAGAAPFEAEVAEDQVETKHRIGLSVQGIGWGAEEYGFGGGFSSTGREYGHASYSGFEGYPGSTQADSGRSQTSQHGSEYAQEA